MKGRIFFSLLIVVGTTIGGVIIASQLDLGSHPFLLFGYTMGILMIVTGVIAILLRDQRQGIQKPGNSKSTAASEVNSTKRTTRRATTAPKVSKKINRFVTTSSPHQSEAVMLAHEFVQYGMSDEARELIEIAHHEGLVSDTEYREWNDSESRGKSKGYFDWLES